MADCTIDGNRKAGRSTTSNPPRTATTLNTGSETFIAHASHIIAGIPREHGGPSYSVPRLVAALRDAGVEARLMTVTDGSNQIRHDVDAYSASWPQLPVLNKFRASRDLKRALEATTKEGGIIHAHGLWQMPTVYAGQLAGKANAKLIVAPRGMLAPHALKFSSARKQLFWRLLQGPALANATCWHATSIAEAEDIRAFGIQQPIAIVPNGTDLPQALATPTDLRGRRMILYIGRLHPIKGLPGLVRAWSAVSSERPNWTLHLAGPDDNGHRAELRRLVQQLKLPRIKISDAVYGKEKQELFGKASIFVLPTLNENFGIAVSEALGAGVPAIVTKGAPWPGLATERCGWWIDRSEGSLIDALRTATALSPRELEEMGKRGRAWMARDFSWDVIAQSMIDVYRWVGKGGQTPSSILAE